MRQFEPRPCHRMGMLLVAFSLILALLPLPRGAAAHMVAAIDKLDSRLQDLIDADARGQDVVAFAAAHGLRVSADKKVLVDVDVNGTVSETTDGLRGDGMDVAAVGDRRPFRGTEGCLPIQAVTQAAARPDVKTVRAVTASGV